MAGRAESAPLASSMLAPMAISLLWRSTRKSMTMLSTANEGEAVV